MEHFPLLALHPTLLEKVITKLEEFSYYGMQHTCWDMHNFIRTSRNITVRAGGLYSLKREGLSFRFSCRRTVEGFYGTRIHCIEVTEDAKGFDLLCDRLEKNRVKCYYLFMFVFGGQVWTKEQCVKLFKILNPVEVFLSSDGSNRYEAVYHTRNLKSAGLRLDADVVATAAPKLLSKYPVVGFNVIVNWEPYSLLLEMLNIYQLKPFPNLRESKLYMYGEWKMPSKEEVEKKLSKFKWTERTNYQGKPLSAVVALHGDSPTGASCEIVFAKSGELTTTQISYKVKATAPCSV